MIDKATVILIAKVAGAALITIALGYLVYKIDQNGYNRCKADVVNSTLKNVEKKIDVKAKQDEVYSAPIDNSVTIRRMRGGSF